MILYFMDADLTEPVVAELKLKMLEATAPALNSNRLLWPRVLEFAVAQLTPDQRRRLGNYLGLLLGERV